MAEMGEIKKDKPKERTPFILLLFLIIAVFAVAAYFVVWPEYGRFTEAKTKLEEQKNLLDAENSTLASVKKLIANYDTISQTDNNKLASMLPEMIDEPGLFFLFEKLALKNNMSLLAIDISEKDPGAELKNLGIKEVDIAANLTGGSYADLKNLISDMESDIRLLDVAAISYTPDPASLTLNIKTYRLGDVAAKN